MTLTQYLAPTVWISFQQSRTYSLTLQEAHIYDFYEIDVTETVAANFSKMVALFTNQVDPRPQRMF